MSQPIQNSMNSVQSDLKGRTEPRIYTLPLCELNEETSYGFDVIDFAKEIGWPLDPWEEWAVIHFGELKENGDPRFRFVLILVARQNGKTTLLRVLTLYWMFIECHPLVAATSADRNVAKKSWREVINMARGIEVLKEELPKVHTRETLGEEVFFNNFNSEYKFFAPNSHAGRGFTVNRAIMDELREHKTSDTYDAMVYAGNAVSDFQCVAITNQGDMSAIVLDEKRDSALEFIETGQGNSSLFLAEWSGPNGCELDDPHALAMANPNLGIRLEFDTLMGQALEAKQKGGKAAASFRTEVLCQRVTTLDAAIQPEIWNMCGNNAPIDMAEHRRGVVLCLDVAPSGEHATLIACVKVENMYHLEVVKSWNGFGCTKQVRLELPELVNKVRPRAFAWFPGGPSASIAADLRAKPSYKHPWPPRNVQIIELKAESVPAVCMGLAESVHSVEIYHPKDELLTQHIRQTQKLRRGDVWIFTRAGNSPVDASYAAAGALHTVKSLPAPLGPVTMGQE